jgi:hypothetical protein
VISRGSACALRKRETVQWSVEFDGSMLFLSDSMATGIPNRDTSYRQQGAKTSPGRSSGSTTNKRNHIACKRMLQNDKLRVSY